MEEGCRADVRRAERGLEVEWDSFVVVWWKMGWEMKMG